MALDFFTLYIVILLNSFFMGLVWLGFVITHRDIPGARLWLAACICTMVGGLLLAGDGTAWGRAFCIAGNLLITLGFCLMWTGLRVFFARPPLWGVCAGALAFGLVLMLVAGPERPGQNIAYAVSQMVPMFLAMVGLTQWGERSLGVLAGLVAIALSFTGQMTEAVLNALRIMGLLSTAAYYEVASVLLLAVICGATIWNLAFLLMAVDRLSARLEELAQHDELTRLPNRRAFNEQAARMVASTQAGGGALSLFMFDIDNFKGINDGMGHAAGDACLRDFARLVEELAVHHLGADARLARLGGDEFALIATGMSAENEEALARDFLRILNERPLEWREWPITLSASIGVASWRGEGALSLPRITEQADAALYEVKRRGRNGYVVAANAGLTGEKAQARPGAQG
ncbi:GGDEF domain-containing protein [Xanthobacter sp. TB0136]|uniref:GGDEF domain-containing protein n=1 Tax=Xanthobacter sp. TB0136 TaxID=3459177 RepID=UPI00403A2AB5